MPAPTDESSAQPAAGTRKPMTTAERARHAALVRWKKKNPLGARLLALREKRKGRAAKPKRTPEDRQAEKDQQQAQNRARVFASLGLFEDATATLMQLAAGEQAEDDGGLVKLGLAELGTDGTLRLTAQGRALLSAANRGDAGRARDALSLGKDRAGRAAEREQPKEKQQEKQQGRGGGGGGGGKGKASDDEKRQKKQEEREQRARDTAEEVGLKPAEVDALRKAAEGDDVAEADVDGLAELGLVEAASGRLEATDAGRRALTALERGDIRGYRAAVQDARKKQEREAARAERTRARETRRAERERYRTRRVPSKKPAPRRFPKTPR
jgi:hypothetical protein